MESKNIPNPNSSFGFSAYNNFSQLDTSFYSPENRRKVSELIPSEQMRAILLTLRAQKEIQVNVDYYTLYTDGLSILKRIKAYNPDVKLLYKDVGIVGTALPHGWDRSVPMKLTDPENSIWEVDVVLSEGNVKFRTRDSWLTNWGGKTFPAGNTIYFGDNIAVKPGKYHVKLNLLENTYEFTRLEHQLETMPESPELLRLP